MTTPTTTPLRIVELHIENVKRLSAFHYKPEGSTVVLGGKNAQGKSSVLDAIEMTLTGKLCQRPIHGEEAKGKVVVDLGEIVVTRTFTKAGGGTLTVAAANGAKFSSPQTLLDELYGKIAFDPLDFTRKKAPEQLNILREIVGINTAMIDSARAGAFEERTDVNREVKRLEGVLSGFAQHENVPSEELSAADLLAKIQEASEQNTTRANLIHSGQIAKMEAENLAARVARQEAELIASKEAHASAMTKLGDLRNQVAQVPEVKTDEWTAQLENITATNKKIAENKRRATVAEDLETKLTAAADLTKKIETFDERKRQKLEAAQYPVKGLRLTDEGIEFNGQPFDQASAAEQLRVSVAIGIAANPRLRVMLVRDASLLDEDSMALMEQLAEEKDVQVWLEKVGTGDGCHVILEDGHIANE